MNKHRPQKHYTSLSQASDAELINMKIDGFTYADIAGIYGATRRTVQRRMLNIRKASSKQNQTQASL
jgi:DNA-directed RNA polymerase specialized sigma24 family protein